MRTYTDLNTDAVLAAAAIMVGTLLKAHPDKREWIDRAVASQGQAFPGADILQKASEAILREVDDPMAIIAIRREHGL